MRIEFHHYDDRETIEILRRLEHKMTAIADAVSALEAKVAAEDTVIGSVETLLAELKQMLADAIANGGNDPALVARVQAVIDHVDAKSSELAQAVTDNTPSASPAPTPAPGPAPAVEPTA
jgi:hypothetical protein